MKGSVANSFTLGGGEDAVVSLVLVRQSSTLETRVMDARDQGTLVAG